MANDKQKLQEKADALRRDLSELDAQIEKMPSQPESVKPIVEGPYIAQGYGAQTVPEVIFGKHHVRLAFATKEQAEKAKAILEKMEFGPCPFEEGEAVAYSGSSGWTNYAGSTGGRMTWCKESGWQEPAWRFGALRKA